MAKADSWLTKENLEKIFNWAKSGLTDEQIAKNMGISKSTFYDWQKKYSEFSESLKKARRFQTDMSKMRCSKMQPGMSMSRRSLPTGKP